jgi:oleandomycin transport system ATP-binding protein
MGTSTSSPGTDAAEALFNAAYPQLAGWINNQVHDDTIAHEIASEAFVRLLSRWTQAECPRSYLYTVATHLIRAQRRKASQQRQPATTAASAHKRISALCQPRQRPLRPVSAAPGTLSVMTNAIVAEALTKRFGPVTAVDGIDLHVKEGTVFGLLGPNGAGKTTTVHILATLVTPDAGHATIAGYDVQTQAHQVRQLIGLAGQYASVDEMLTGTENLVLLARLTGASRPSAKQRAKDLLTQFRLEDAAARAVKTYSGGMRRRLDLAASLVANPRVLFLDEPTTGLDPRSRNDMWNVIRELTTSHGVTVLLTTQYLEEADQLAERIAVVDHGRMIATGTPAELKASTGSDTLDDVFLALTGHEIEPAADNDLEESLA